MTETMTPLEPSELAGKTRAELLELCRARGLKATAWKRDRMHAALTGQDVPVPEPRKNVLAGQLEARREENGSGSDARRAAENREKRTGACQSLACSYGCEAYAFERRDAFGWHTCVCGHTQWGHAAGDQAGQVPGATEPAAP
jgi:hypothetical protein